MHPYLTKIKAHWRLHGLMGTSVSILVACLDKLGFRIAGTDAFSRFLHVQFDKKMNVQTADSNELLEADIPLESHQDARSYEASPAVELFQILNSLAIDSQTTFVDIGCGKGKAMLVASLFPFAKLEGVELSKKLVQECQENFDLASLQRRKIPDHEVVCSDALTYDFPETDLVVYLFNPFGRTVLKKVLFNLQQSIEAHQRKVVIIYCNAIHYDCLDEGSDWTPLAVGIPLGRWWRCYSNIPPV